MKKIVKHVHPVVFGLSAGLIFLFVGLSALWTDGLLAHMEGLRNLIVESMSWLYTLAMTSFVVLAIYLGLSRYGRIKLGPKDSSPEFSNFAWVSMMFSAGMGIGLLFYGVAEPLLHFMSPPPIFTGKPLSIEAAHYSMGITLFHWGFHPWACYSLLGAALAYYGFRKGKPFSFRYLLEPILGKRVHGILGDLTDVIVIWATLFGVATSLGLGASQLHSGIRHLAGEQSWLSPTLIVVVVTLFATISVVSGLKNGIRIISQTTLGLALGLMILVLLLGPTTTILNASVENLGHYLKILPQHSFWTAAQSEVRQSWLSSWTIFYWAWWISWSPFVGLFIARISKGRTIKEFVFASLLLPTGFTVLWMSIMGSSAIHLDLSLGHVLSEYASKDVSMTLFSFLDLLSGGPLLNVLALSCIFLFFVSSSDSASLVIDTLASGGSREPHKLLRVFWALLEGAVAAALLYLGGLEALQMAAINASLPFSILILLALWGFFRSLKGEQKTL